MKGHGLGSAFFGPRPRLLAAGVVAAGTFVAVALSGCGSTKNKVQSDLAIVQGESTPEKLVGRGRAFATVGDWTRAEQYFVSALDAGADDRVVVPLLLRVCVADKRLRAAIDYAENHVAKHPTDMDVRYVLGTLYLAVGDGAQARTHLEQVLRARPNDADVHFALATVLKNSLGDHLGADTHFRAYLRIAPRGLHAEQARGNLLNEVPPPLPESSAPRPVVAPLPPEAERDAGLDSGPSRDGAAPSPPRPTPI